MGHMPAVPRSHVRILAILLLLGLVVRLGMIWIDFNLLTCGLEVVQDDSMNNYRLARNIMKGWGLSFEPGEKTTSFHPPSVLLILPFMWLFPHSKEVPIQCLLTLYTVISLLTALVIYRAVRALSGPPAALLSAGFWVLAYGVATYSINGADTPVTALFLALSFDYYLRKIHRVEGVPLGRYGVLGILCGLAILSRMDSLALLPAFGLHILWCHRREGLAGLRRVVAAGLVMALAVAVTSSPIFLTDEMVHGQFQVHNASSNRTLSIVLGHYLKALGAKNIVEMRLEGERSTPLHPLVPDLDGNIYPIWWGLYVLSVTKSIAVILVKYADVVVTLLLFLLVVFWSALRQGKGMRKSRFRQFLWESGVDRLSVVLLYGGILYSLYAFYQFSVWHSSRYMYPMALVATFYLGPVGAWALANVVLPRLGGRIPLQRALICLFLVCFVSLGAQIYWNLYRNLCEGGNGFIQAARWLNENTPKDAVVGAYQSGYFGYYLDREYHDLAGKMTISGWNSWISRPGWDYVREKGVDYILDEDAFLDFNFAWTRMYPIKGKLELVNNEFGRRPGPKSPRILIYKVKHPR